MPAERPEQYDMFSGELKDNRTRKQKTNARKQEQSHQEFLFPQRELAQQSRKRFFPLSPATKLELLSVDPRTDEERERDQQKAIEDATYKLFDEEGNLPDTQILYEDTEQESAELEDDMGAEYPGGNPLDVYLELVRFSEEQTETLWIAQPYETAYLTQIAATMLVAQSLGLTEYEISTAIRIGQFLGEKQRQGK